MRHLGSFWAVRDRPNVVLLRYEDLLADLEGEMRYLSRCLGIEVPETAWRQLVEAATFEQMKASAAEIAPETDLGFWKQTASFFHHGTSQQWRRILADADLPRYVSKVHRCAPAELIEWVHDPPLPAQALGAAGLGDS
jgi:hypothetical protein